MQPMTPLARKTSGKSLIASICGGVIGLGGAIVREFWEYIE